MEGMVTFKLLAGNNKNIMKKITISIELENEELEYFASIKGSGENEKDSFVSQYIKNMVNGDIFNVLQGKLTKELQTETQDKLSDLKENIDRNTKIEIE